MHAASALPPLQRPMMTATCDHTERWRAIAPSYPVRIRGQASRAAARTEPLRTPPFFLHICSCHSRIDRAYYYASLYAWASRRHRYQRVVHARCRRDVRGVPASLQDVASGTRAFYLMTSGRPFCAQLSSHASAWKARSGCLLHGACTAGLVAAFDTCMATRWALHGLNIAAVNPRGCGTTAVYRAGYRFSLHLCQTAAQLMRCSVLKNACGNMSLRRRPACYSSRTLERLASVRVSACSGRCCLKR